MMDNKSKTFIWNIIYKLQILLADIKNAYIRKSDDKKNTYQVAEFYKNNAGEQLVVAKIIDSPRGFFKLSATELVLRHKDILSRFDINDIVNIVGLVTTDKEAKIIYKKPTTYKYLSVLAMFFGAAIITANIASSKLISVLGYTMTGGALVYPVAYILGDIITEVYGYKRARQLIWGAIICNLFVVIFIAIAILEPPSPYWHYQKEYELILGSVPRVMFASLTAYWSGEFINSYIIAKLKIFYNGQKLWIRILSAAIFGITADSMVFVLIAFSWILPLDQMCYLAIKVYIFNLTAETLSIPFSMLLINKLKANESLDIFDINTKFTPFSLDVEYSEFNNKMHVPTEYEYANEEDAYKNVHHPGYLAK